MRRYWVLLFFMLSIFLYCTTEALAADPTLMLGYNGGANANPHNLSSQSSNTIRANSGGDQNATHICVFCHAPHGATPQSTLWNRPAPDAGPFPTYAYPADIVIDDNPVNALAQYGPSYGEYPNGATKMCLSCHDGATAIGTMANGITISMTQNTITDAKKHWNPGVSGGDFSRTHPVSFFYTVAVKDAINNAKGGGYDRPAGTFLLVDSQQRIQCTTCHDPHLDTDAADGDSTGGAYALPFWRVHTGSDALAEAADYDAVCIQCHTGTPPLNKDPGGYGGNHNL